VAAVHLTWCTAPWVIYNVRCMASPKSYMVKGAMNYEPRRVPGRPST
jgi:hypothetical protein